MKFFAKVSFLIVFLALVSVLTGCQTVPYTGRSQFVLTSESYENELGEEAWQQVNQEEKISTNVTYNQALNRVGKNIAKAADKPSYNWEFRVFDSNVPNAYCLPGGKIAVYTAIFQYMDNDGELAAVIGHEVSHALARHGGERMSQEMVQSAGAQVLSSSGAGTVAEIAYGVTTNIGGILPYSRVHEYEADKMGIILMAKAGYDPRCAVTFWQKFAAADSTSSVGEYFSTHPLGKKRIEELQKMLPEAMNYYNQAPVKLGVGTKYK